MECFFADSQVHEYTIKPMKFYKLLIIFISFSYCCLAQGDGPKYTSKSEKAIKYFEKAQKSFDARLDDEAIKSLQKAIEIDPQFVEAHVFLSEIYGEHKKYDLALQATKAAIELNGAFFPRVFFNAGTFEMKLEKYSEAKADFQKFLTFTRISPDARKEAEFLLKSAEFAEYAIKNPVPFNPQNLGSEINSPNEEYSPTLTVDEQTIIFTVKEPSGPNQALQEDFYISNYKNGKWDAALNMGAPINTEGNEGAQNISPDGQIMFFTACEEPGYGYPGSRKGYGSCDIFFSQRVGNRWSPPQNVGPPVSSRYWDAQPCISPDGNTLYFTSSRPGGKGGADIWMSTLTPDGYWGTPVNMGDSINTPYSEVSPFIHPDNKTFYFASEGHPGLGGEDLFFSRRAADGSWGVAKNLGYPINTSGDEISLIVSASGKNAYYSSERKDGNGKLDLYSFELYKEARPLAVTYVKGVVTDKETKAPLEAKFELIDLASGKKIMESYSNPGNGEFLVSLPTEKNYALNASKNGYLFYSENFSLIGKSNNAEPFIMNVALNPVKPGEKVVLRNIFFETGSFKLKEESKVELETLISFLNKNNSISIEISGHTDNVGDKKSNQILSENRAKAVYEYVVSKGIDSKRLTYKGYGDTRPLVPNDSELNRAINRRTEFTIL